MENMVKQRLIMFYYALDFTKHLPISSLMWASLLSLEAERKRLNSTGHLKHREYSVHHCNLSIEYAAWYRVDTQLNILF